MNIGVFDTGLGGRNVAEFFRHYFPEDNIKLVTDTEHLPYGNRTQEEIIELTDIAIRPLIENCPIIVLACNTATAAAIDSLRHSYPAVHFVGVEPMVKPAAGLSKSGVIAVLATPATLRSARYIKLKKSYASGVTVIEPDCSSWAEMIENGHINEKLIEDTIISLRQQKTDVILLSCTHYHAIKDMIGRIAGNDTVILEPSEALANRVGQLKETLPL